MKKTMHTLLVCLMLLALCAPMLNAFALNNETEEKAKTVTTVIDELRVSIEIPAGGRAPSFEAAAMASSMLEYKIANYNYEYDSEYYHNFYKNGIQWYDLDKGRALKEGEAFVTGTRYRVDIAIYLNYGTDIWGIPYYSFGENVAGYVNGAEGTVSTLGVKDTDKFRKISYTFPPCEDAPADIASVSLWFMEPVAGTAPDYEYSTSDKGYTTGVGGTFAVNGITWQDADTGLPLDFGDTFAEGTRYTVIVPLEAVTPYRFAVNPDESSKVYASINGNKATVYCNSQTVSDMDKRIWVKYTFEPCKKIISTVEVMNFTLPKEGKKGNLDMYSPNDDAYKVTDILWKSPTETIAVWHQSTGYTSQTGVFESGVTYTAEITVAAGAGYMFATDSNDNPTVKTTGAGFELEVKPHYAYASSSHIIVVARFICKKTIVSDVSIKNLEEPLAGKRPDYTASSVGVGYRIATENEEKEKVLRNGQYVDLYYKIRGVSWYDVNEGRYVYEDEKFIQGHVYTAIFDIVTTGDYEFSINKDEAYSQVIATVNDSQALAYFDESPETKHFVEYTISCQYVFEDDRKTGDVNEDGKVNNLDAATVLKYDAGIIDLSLDQKDLADVNGDAKVNNLDASMILKYDAGIIGGF